MSVRVGRIMRHEDVHGVSGTGKVADVFEASNGKAVVIWISSNPSVVVYDNVKAVENVHGHGGKTEVVWEWEAPRDPDPMDAVIERKVAEAGGSGATGATAVEAEKDAEADAIADEIVEDAKQAIDRVAGKVAERLTQATVEKVEKKAAEKQAVLDNRVPHLVKLAEKDDAEKQE